MEGMENKISALLSDPASMEKVMSMAKALQGGNVATPATPVTNTESAPLAASALSALGDGSDLIKIIGSLDPKILNGVSRIFTEYSRPDDERVRLLHALKPYIREQRRDKMDKAVNIVKMAHTARIALEAFNGR